MSASLPFPPLRADEKPRSSHVVIIDQDLCGVGSPIDTTDRPWRTEQGDTVHFVRSAQDAMDLMKDLERAGESVIAVDISYFTPTLNMGEGPLEGNPYWAFSQSVDHDRRGLGILEKLMQWAEENLDVARPQEWSLHSSNWVGKNPEIDRVSFYVWNEFSDILKWNDVTVPTHDAPGPHQNIIIPHVAATCVRVHL